MIQFYAGCRFRKLTGSFAALLLVIVLTHVNASAADAPDESGGVEQCTCPDQPGAEEAKPVETELQYVHPLVGTEPGYNDSNPVWSPSGDMIAFERSRGDKKEIVFARRDGTVVQHVSFQGNEEENDLGMFLPGMFEESSYNSGITWAPSGNLYVFMSNGDEGNYDLYLRAVGGKKGSRLTDDREKDGQADWSPVDDRITFVSGRTGNGDVYVLQLITGSLRRLTRGAKAFLYPRWSPDGKRIAMIYGSNENHDIYVINDVKKPAETLKALTVWPADDLRPVWSPDGKKIAFYSNYNPEGDPGRWSLFVIEADGSSPTEGEGLESRMVASDVVPDVEAGPAWMPDSSRLVYVKNDRQEYNPLYIADVRDKSSRPLSTDTKMNHDVACSSDGVIAFRAQVDQWDHIFIAKLKEQ